MFTKFTLIIQSCSFQSENVRSMETFDLETCFKTLSLSLSSKFKKIEETQISVANPCATNFYKKFQDSIFNGSSQFLADIKVANFEIFPFFVIESTVYVKICRAVSKPTSTYIITNLKLALN